MTTPAGPSDQASPVSLGSLPRRALVLLVRGYQLVISPWTPPSCRFHPSCSTYAVTALERHGALRGTWLAVRRLGRCHPWTSGGIDDVPPVRVTAPSHSRLTRADARPGQD